MNTNVANSNNNNINNNFNNNNNLITSLYIPRIGSMHTEQSVMYIFRNCENIGDVAFVDFVAIKDKEKDKDQKESEQKQPKFYSAFIQMAKWNIHSNVYQNIQRGRRHDLIVDHHTGEFWMILPSKAEMLPRLKVNIHQLGAYTSELFEKNAKIQELVEAQDKKIKEQTDELEKQKNINEQLEDRLLRLEYLLEHITIPRNLGVEFSNSLNLGPPPKLTRQIARDYNSYDDFIDRLTNNIDRSVSPVQNRTIVSNHLCGNN